MSFKIYKNGRIKVINIVLHQNENKVILDQNCYQSRLPPLHIVGAIADTVVATEPTVANYVVVLAPTVLGYTEVLVAKPKEQNLQQ